MRLISWGITQKQAEAFKPSFQLLLSNLQEHFIDLEVKAYYLAKFKQGRACGRFHGKTVRRCSPYFQKMYR